MKSAEKSIQQTMQRKFLLILPLLAFPFLTFLLWSIGVVGERTGRSPAAKPTGGLNTSLPDPHIPSDKGWDKMTYYQQADQDSARYQDALRSDPYYSERLRESRSQEGSARDAGDNRAGIMGQPDPNVERVNQKLAELSQALAQSAGNDQAIELQPANDFSRKEVDDTDAGRPERLLNAARGKEGQADPEMEQLNRIMDKIIAVQYPEMMRDSIRKLSEENRQEVYPVTLPEADNISLLENDKPGYGLGLETDQDTATGTLALRNQFYGLDDSYNPITQNTVSAIIPETQTVVDGAVLKLCLSDDIYLAGVRVSRGSFVYGRVRLSGERLLVNIASIRQENNILPVSLSAYDLDGISGIYIPGAITRDVAKQSGDRAIQGIGMTSLDPSFGAQAAGAGIQAAKTLIGQRVRLVKVTVKSGYRLLLKDDQNH